MGCLQGELCAPGRREVSSDIVGSEVTPQSGDGVGGHQACPGEAWATREPGGAARNLSIDPWDLRDSGRNEPDPAGDFVTAGGGVAGEANPALVPSLVGRIYPWSARDLLDGPKSRRYDLNC